MTPFWRSARASRSTLARMMPAPVSPSAIATIGTCRSPPVRTCAAANKAANSTPSMTLRATSSAATAELARRTTGSEAQGVDHDSRRLQLRSHAVLGLLDRDREDAVLRAPQGEQPAGQ